MNEIFANYNVGDFLSVWQTLLAGAVAFFGAFLTCIILIIQHRFDKKRHREDREREAFYHRSQLPDALCDLVGYSEACFKYVYDDAPLPEKPVESIGVLKLNIRYSDIKTSQSLFEIISFYQVHNSRLEAYHESLAMNKTENMLYDIAKLYHFFNSLFSYARNEAKTVNRIFPSKEEMEKSVKDVIGRDRVYNERTKFEHIFADAEKHRATEAFYLRSKAFRSIKRYTDKIKTKLLRVG